MNLFAPWQGGSRIKAVVGHYGSGKTELSIALALAAAEQGKRTALADLDIVNPFFRSAEQGALLKAAGVELIAPPYALTAVDVPALPADVFKIFAQEDLFSVLDVGGDDAGAAALGGYRAYFAQNKPDVYYVVNPYRPFSGTPEQVIDMMERIFRRGRVEITGLINNANIARETTKRELLAGRALLEEVTRLTGVPCVCVSGLPAVLREADDLGAPVFPIERRLIPKWLEEA